MLPQHSPEDRAFIHSLTHGVLMGFTGTVHLLRHIDIYKAEYVASHPELFSWDWVNIIDLRVFIASTTSPAPAQLQNWIKTEPDISPRQLSATAPNWRVLHEDGNEVLDLCSDSEIEDEPDNFGNISTRRSPASAAPQAAPRQNQKLLRVEVEEVLDEDVLRSQERASLPPDSHRIWEVNPAYASSLPPSSPPGLSTDNSDHVEFEGPRALENHRRPDDFNQLRYTDWTESDTNWGHKNLKFFARNADFKLTSHKTKTVQQVEYIFDTPPYLPVHDIPTATVIDLNHPKYDNMYASALDDEEAGDGNMARVLMTVNGRVKKSDNDSWDGTPGTGDPPVNVRFGPDKEPTLLPGALYMQSVSGGFACSFVDWTLFAEPRRYFDPTQRKSMFAVQRENRGAEGTTKEQKVAEFVNIVRKLKCCAVDSNGQQCKGFPILKESKGTGPAWWLACSGWRKNFKQGHRNHTITCDVPMFLRAFHNQPIAEDDSKDTKQCADIVHPICGKKKKGGCCISHIVGGISRKGDIEHHPCKVKRTIYWPVDRSIRKALIWHDATKPAHTHPLPAFTKVTPEAVEGYDAAIAAFGVASTTVGKVEMSASTPVALGGKTPGQFAPALQSTAVKGRLIHRGKEGIPLEWVSQASAFHMYQEDLKRLNVEDRYVHRVVTVAAGGTMILTCVPGLLELLDDKSVNSFEADTTFKCVIGEFNEWEVTIFYKPLNRAITIARVYINRATTEFFEDFFDELRSLKIELTKSDLAFSCLTKGGNLLAFNSDMESAQVLGAVRSFFKTHDAVYSTLAPTLTAEDAILDFKSLATDEDYKHILTFAETIKSAEDLTEFSEFIHRLNVKKITATTNTGESQHHWTNTRTGIKLPLVEAIVTAHKLHLQVYNQLLEAFESGVVTNPYNDSAQRKIRNLTRLATTTRKTRETNEQAAERARIDDELEGLKQQKKEADVRMKELRLQKQNQSTGKVSRGARAGDSSCGRVKSRSMSGSKIVLSTATLNDSDDLVPSDMFEPLSATSDTSLGPEAAHASPAVLGMDSVDLSDAFVPAPGLDQAVYNDFIASLSISEVAHGSLIGLSMDSMDLSDVFMPTLGLDQAMYDDFVASFSSPMPDAAAIADPYNNTKGLDDSWLFPALDNRGLNADAVYHLPPPQPSPPTSPLAAAHTAPEECVEDWEKECVEDWENVSNVPGVSKLLGPGAIEDMVVLRWSSMWTMATQGRGLRDIDSSPPCLVLRPPYKSTLPHADISAMAQLRTDFSLLNAHRFRCRLTDSPACPACGAPYETRAHFLLQCPTWEPFRIALQSASYSAGLLGAVGVRPLLNEPLLLKATVAFIHKTGRFLVTRS
ncbi:hypothetical protein K438DRAFT_1992965 [Mycena galopus ATCC 62051]|nr:hypothetical protein K438DRAFT_1992965 [Mycena galopus ATCC 62051]